MRKDEVPWCLEEGAIGSHKHKQCKIAWTGQKASASRPKHNWTLGAKVTIADICIVHMTSLSWGQYRHWDENGTRFTGSNFCSNEVFLITGICTQNLTIPGLHWLALTAECSLRTRSHTPRFHQPSLAHTCWQRALYDVQHPVDTQWKLTDDDELY